MRLCIHDVRTRKFTKMIEPIIVESCIDNEFILYVYDAYGACYTMRFPTHEQLKNCVISLRNDGYASALGDLNYCDPVISDREIEYDEMELTH